jgi:succinate dehydrogenase / fumarate reductase cytochrome b subunit
MAQVRTTHIERPLSPHVQIYRWPLTMLLSILHRITGVGLGLGMVLLIGWLLATACGAEAYELARHCLSSVLGRLILIAFTLTLVFHALNGVRHLVWDLGYGFVPRTATLTGWLVVLLTFAITALAWVWGLGLMGEAL